MGWSRPTPDKTISLFADCELSLIPGQLLEKFLGGLMKLSLLNTMGNP